MTVSRAEAVALNVLMCALGACVEDGERNRGFARRLGDQAPLEDGVIASGAGCILALIFVLASLDRLLTPRLSSKVTAHRNQANACGFGPCGGSFLA
jgi:hypothetical protein